MNEILPDELANRLQVGLSMQLVFEVTNAMETSYEVEVRGWEESSYILTTVPDYKPGMVPVRGGLPVTARILAGGIAFGFHTRIIEIQSRPVSVMFLQYPGSVAMKDVRAHRRISVFIMASLTTQVDDKSVDGTAVIRDLAVGGCCIETRMDLLIGTEMNLRFVLPDGKSVENVVSVVRNQREAIDGYAYGLQFLADKSPAETKKIQDFFVSIGEVSESTTS